MKNKQKKLLRAPHHGKNCLKQNTKAPEGEKRHNTFKTTTVFQQLII